MVYNPLAGGLLTGRHSLPTNPPRAASATPGWLPCTPKDIGTTASSLRSRRCRPLRGDAGIGLVELSLRWLLSNPDVGAVLLGGSRSPNCRPTSPPRPPARCPRTSSPPATGSAPTCVAPCRHGRRGRDRPGAGPPPGGGPAVAVVGSAHAGDQEHLAGFAGEEVDCFVGFVERHAVGDQPFEVEPAGVQQQLCLFPSFPESPAEDSVIRSGSTPRVRAFALSGQVPVRWVERAYPMRRPDIVLVEADLIRMRTREGSRPRRPRAGSAASSPSSNRGKRRTSPSCTEPGGHTTAELAELFGVASSNHLPSAAAQPARCTNGLVRRPILLRCNASRVQLGGDARRSGYSGEQCCAGPDLDTVDPRDDAGGQGGELRQGHSVGPGGAACGAGSGVCPVGLRAGQLHFRGRIAVTGDRPIL